MKNLKVRKGFKNRHTDGLPTTKTMIKVVIEDIEGERVLICSWHPFDPADYSGKISNTGFGGTLYIDWPCEGFLGTAITVTMRHQIGFHAWEQNDSEFVYYKIA